jgi:dTDP-glucose 4,6-dehydratase
VRSLLITGGAGFIGSHFTEHWLATHAADRVVVLDALTYAGDRRHLDHCQHDARFRFVHGDIADRARVEELLREERIDTVVHFAAESHVDRSIADPDAFVATNITGTHSLLAAAKKVWIDEGRATAHRFHQVSTDEVYGSRGPDEPAADERSAYAPNSPYSASKAAADHLVRAYARTYGLAATLSNSCNNYGARQFPEKLIPRVIVNALQGRAIPVYGDGRQQRNWIHVRDHCHGITLVLENGECEQVYHLGAGAGAGDALENLELVQKLCSAIDAAFAADPSLISRFPQATAARGGTSRSLIEFVADRPGHDRRYAVDGAKARRELGFAPRIALEPGLAETVDWYLANESWWHARR